MLATCVRRGLAAGLLAGLLAGLVGLVGGEPALEDAIALEGVDGGEADQAASQAPAVSRPQQRIGLVVGSGLLGVGIGAVFGIAAAWAAGRVEGDAWQRSLKLGAAAVGALVLLPALKYPALPPGVGDPAAVTQRTALFLGLGVVGLLLAFAGWAAARQLAATGLPRASRQTFVAIGLIVAGALVIAVLPADDAVADVPADLLWSFRVGAIATQVALYGGTAVVFGLLASPRGGVPPAIRPTTGPPTSTGRRR